MVKDGEDWHGLQKAELEKFRLNFLRCGKSEVAPLLKGLKRISSLTEIRDCVSVRYSLF